MIGAVLFDFNGTLSEDEPILCELWQEIFAEHGRPLAREEYFDRLAGLSDPEIAEAWLGKGHPALAAAIEEHVRRYRERVADGSTVSPDLRAVVRAVAATRPVGVVSGAMRAEVAPVLAAAGLAEAVSVLVTADDVAHGKPDPESYLLALARLGWDGAPGDVLAFEDSEAGILAAKAAGLRCVALLGTLPRARLTAAAEIVERIDLRLLERLLAG